MIVEYMLRVVIWITTITNRMIRKVKRLCR